MGLVHFNKTKLEEIGANGNPDDSIVMLNMLKFRDVAEEGVGVDGMSGEQAYREVLGKMFADLHPKYGGTPIWMGKGGITVLGYQDWDLIILVKYPSREKFVEMVLSPEYKKVTDVRAAAVKDSRLVEMTQLVPEE